MESSFLKDKDIIMKIDVTNPRVRANDEYNNVKYISNENDEVNISNVTLTLTKNALQMSYVEYPFSEDLGPVGTVTKIPLERLSRFVVIENRSKKEEMIEIRADNMGFLFIRDNTDYESHGLTMSRLIYDIKGI